MDNRQAAQYKHVMTIVDSMSTKELREYAEYMMMQEFDCMTDEELAEEIALLEEENG